MKKKFTVEFMLGCIDTKEIILTHPNQIQFFTEFLEIYKKRCEAWESIYEWKEDERKTYIPEIERLRFLAEGSATGSFDLNTSAEDLHDWVSVTLLMNTIGACYLGSYFGAIGQLLSYTIVDIDDTVD